LFIPVYNQRRVKVCIFNCFKLMVAKGDGMDTVTSKDGTRIAFDKEGKGPAVILVAGALCARLSWSGPEIARLLAPHYTVYNYDRRGRGDSGDTLPFAVQREIEDIEALIDDAGGSAALFGHSSGACLAMEAAQKLGSKVNKLAMYEAPYDDDPQDRQLWGAYIQQLTELLAANRRGDAVALFMRFVGTPAEQIDNMRQAPFWAGLEALAPSLAREHAALLGKVRSIPIERASRVKVPALIMYGGASYPFMKVTAQTLSRAMPHAELCMLEGQTHDVKTEALVPVLEEFFTKEQIALVS
jgi:pimeloyl-ACP methyl ester carboxylesterase